MIRSFSVTAMLFLLLLTASGQGSLADDLFAQGTQAARSGEFGKAIEKYKRALFYIDKDERNAGDRLARVYSNIGVCLYRMKRYDAAESEFRKAVILSGGGYQRALYGLG